MTLALLLYTDNKPQMSSWNEQMSSLNEQMSSWNLKITVAGIDCPLHHHHHNLLLQISSSGGMQNLCLVPAAHDMSRSQLLHPVIIIIIICGLIQRTYPPTKWCSRRIITPAHKAHTSFLKPSQLPGEYTAQLLPLQRI